jgi:hypothetical protein
MLIYKNPKAKSCEVCERLFVPDRMGQLVCRPACALKKVRQAKVEERAKIKTRREKAKTTGQRKAEAQAAINKWVVHVRDRDQPCISCGRFHEGMYHAGHYRSRGSAPHLALDPRNLHKQCAPCNLHLHGNLIEYRKGLIARYGISHVEELESDQTPRHLSHDDIDAIRDTYRAKRKEFKP